MRDYFCSGGPIRLVLTRTKYVRIFVGVIVTNYSIIIEKGKKN